VRQSLEPSLDRRTFYPRTTPGKPCLGAGFNGNAPPDFTVQEHDLHPFVFPRSAKFWSGRVSTFLVLSRWFSTSHSFLPPVPSAPRLFSPRSRVDPTMRTALHLWLNMDGHSMDFLSKTFSTGHPSSIPIRQSTRFLARQEGLVFPPTCSTKVCFGVFSFSRASFSHLPPQEVTFVGACSSWELRGLLEVRFFPLPAAFGA